MNLTAHTLFNPNFGGVPVAPDRPCWASARAQALSYLAVKLFSKNSNLCVADTYKRHGQTDRQTDGRLTVASPRSALASRGKKCSLFLKLLFTCDYLFTYSAALEKKACLVRTLEFESKIKYTLPCKVYTSLRCSFMFFTHILCIC